MMFLFVSVFPTEVTLYIISVSAHFSHVSLPTEVAKDIRVFSCLAIIIVGIMAVIAHVSTPGVIGVIVVAAMDVVINMGVVSTTVSFVGVRHFMLDIMVVLAVPGIITILESRISRAVVNITLVVAGLVVSVVAIAVTRPVALLGSIVIIVMTIVFGRPGSLCLSVLVSRWWVFSDIGSLHIQVSTETQCPLLVKMYVISQ
jgi:hypothetical protein